MRGEVVAAEQVPDIEYVPTPQNVVDKLLDVAKIGRDDVLYDLGCGDGRIVINAAKRFGIKAVGFDIDPKRVAESRANVKSNKVEHLVTIEQQDIFTVDLSKATVVTLYLLPELNVRLIPQLEKLKPGSRVVSHDFDMEGAEPENHWTVIARDHREPEESRALRVLVEDAAEEDGARTGGYSGGACGEARGEAGEVSRWSSDCCGSRMRSSRRGRGSW